MANKHCTQSITILFSQSVKGLVFHIMEGTVAFIQALLFSSPNPMVIAVSNLIRISMDPITLLLKCYLSNSVN